MPQASRHEKVGTANQLICGEAEAGAVKLINGMAWYGSINTPHLQDATERL